MLRRLRAMLITATLWAAAWTVAGTLLVVATLLLARNPGFVPPRFFLVQAAYWAVWGGLSGMIFAGTMTIAERRRTLDELSRVRVAVWGAIGGFALPLLTIFVAVLGSSFRIRGLGFVLMVSAGASILGATLAALHLSLARRAPALPGEVRARRLSP